METLLVQLKVFLTVLRRVDREAIFLTDLEEIQIVNPAEVKLVPDHSPRFRKSLLYLESQWRQKIPTDTNIHIGYKAAMDPMPYQLDPAKQALQRPRQRILIADTVGLGKTLEAGILMSELIARGKGKRILADSRALQGIPGWWRNNRLHHGQL